MLSVYSIVYVILIQIKYDVSNKKTTNHNSEKIRTEKHITINDRISPMDMKLVADYYFGSKMNFTENKYYERECIKVNKKMLNMSLIENLFDGVIIFVESKTIRYFIHVYLPYIKVKFVLISGDTDGRVPSDFPGRLKGLELVTDERILYWYAMNCDSNPFPQKFSCIPNGVGYSSSSRKSIQEAYESGLGLIGNGLEQNYLYAKQTEKYLLVSFKIANNPIERKHAYNHVCRSALINISKCIESVEVKEFYKLVAKSRFVLSPHGAGLDCYRF